MGRRGREGGAVMLGGRALSHGGRGRKGETERGCCGVVWSALGNLPGMGALGPPAGGGGKGVLSLTAAHLRDTTTSTKLSEVATSPIYNQQQPPSIVTPSHAHTSHHSPLCM